MTCQCYSNDPNKDYHLIRATIAGHAHCVDLLLNERYDLDLEVKAMRWPYHGKTALLIAAAENYLAIVRSLLHAGAQVLKI